MGLPILRIAIAGVLALAPVARVSPGAAGQDAAAGAARAEDAIAMVADSGEGARYWPRWRGPSGQGLVAGTNFPDRWSSTENVAWKVPVPGEGNSSPIIWGDRIILTTAYDGGRRLSVLALRRSDGGTLWETPVPQGRNDWVHAKNGHASSTPATDGTRIYALFGSRGLMALDMEGRIQWRADIGPTDNYHGPAGSPLLYKDRVILYQDQARDAFVAAFDTRTGRQVWRTRREASVGWGTPIAVRVVDHDEIIVNSQRAVQAYHPDTGKELWRCNGMGFEVIPTPVVGHGMVFCSSGRAGPTLAIKPGGSGDVTRTHLAWSTERGSPFVPSPLLYRGQLYMVNDMASIVTSFDAATGRSLWQGRLGVAQREGFSASPVAVDGKVFFTNDDGETFVLRTGPAFSLLHVNTLGERVLASPALVGGRWYFRTESRLYAIAAR